MFWNFSFFGAIDSYINKNLALLRLSKAYVETKPEFEVFNRASYIDKNDKKTFLTPVDFFSVDEKAIGDLVNFQILEPHFCTDVAIYHGDYEADLFIPFFNSKTLSERVALVVQKEVLYLSKKKANIFINQGNDAANISYYSLFIFLVDLYCFEEEQTIKVREDFENFLESKDLSDLFIYFVVSFKNHLDKIKPLFNDLYSNNYVDCRYSRDIVNSNKKIALKLKIKYSEEINLAYIMKIPAVEATKEQVRELPIEFLLEKEDAAKIFKNSINNLVPYSIKFIGRNSPPIFKYARDLVNGLYIEAPESEVSFGLNFKREKIQTVFYKNLNSRDFANQMKKYEEMVDNFNKNNVSAIRARKFIVEISDTLLKNALLISSLP